VGFVLGFIRALEWCFYLYKRWETSNLKNVITQLIVPKSRIKQILEEAHDSPSQNFGEDSKKILLGIL